MLEIVARRWWVGAALLPVAFTLPDRSPQDMRTDLPAGLTFPQVLLASGLQMDASDTAGWTAQQGGSQTVSGVSLYQSVAERSIRFPGVDADSVRKALVATVRAELSARGVEIVERPGTRAAAARQHVDGAAAVLRYRVPDAGSRGWVTMIVLPEADRMRITIVSVEAR